MDNTHIYKYDNTCIHMIKTYVWLNVYLYDNTRIYKIIPVYTR